MKNQSKQSEKLNDILQPIFPLDCDDFPSSSLMDDDDSSFESDDDRIVSAAGPFCKAPEGATAVLVPPPQLPERLKVPTSPSPP